MISVAPKITDAGKNLLLRAIGGEEITFTRFKIGNGELSDTDFTSMLDLINPLVEFSITDIDKSGKGFIKLKGTFDSTYITSDFRWRELGIFCKGEDGAEVLYAYSNDGNNAGMLKANSSDVVAEQTVALIIAVGDAEKVTAILSESVLYVPKTEFNEHVANEENPHKITKAQVGLGNVPNVATNDQTPTYSVPTLPSQLQSGEKLRIAFGKIAIAIKNLIEHISNKKNPHNVTVLQIGAAKAEHSHSSADFTSGVISVSRGGTGAATPEEALANLGATQMATGEYEGNYDGSTGNVRITFPFTPKVVIVMEFDSTLRSSSGEHAYFFYGVSYAMDWNSGIPCTWSGNTLSWTGILLNGMNESTGGGIKYRWMAWG